MWRKPLDPFVLPVAAFVQQPGVTLATVRVLMDRAQAAVADTERTAAQAQWLLAVSDMISCGDCASYDQHLRVLSVMERLSRDARIARFWLATDPETVLTLHVNAQQRSLNAGYLPVLARDIMRNLAAGAKPCSPACLVDSRLPAALGCVVVCVCGSS